MVLQLMAFPYMRSSGLGSAFHGEASRLPAAIAAAVTGVAALLIGGIGGMVVFGVICLVAILVGRGISAMVGGLTGDSYGATNELCEVVALLAMTAILPYHLLEPIYLQAPRLLATVIRRDGQD